MSRPLPSVLSALALLALVVCGVFAWASTPPPNPTLATVMLPLDPRQPVAIAVDAATRRAFVASAGLVYTLDLDRNALLRTTRTSHPMDNPSTSPTPAILAVDVRVGHVFVANYANGTLSMLDAGNGQLVHTGNTMGSPVAMAIDEHTGQVFVGSAENSLLDALDARTGDELPTSVGIASNGSPSGIAIDAHLYHGFATDHDGGVAMFDTRTDMLLHTEQGHAFTSLAVDARTGRVFAVGDATRNLSVFDARSGATLPAVPVGLAPDAIAVDERTGRAFTSNYGDGTVSAVDTGGLRALSTVAVGPNPMTVVDERRGRVVVASDTAVSVLDAHAGHLLHRESLALSPQAIALDEQTGHVLVVGGPSTRWLPTPWGWLPSPLRHLLPFLSSPRSRTQTIPSRIIVLDESRLVVQR